MYHSFWIHSLADGRLGCFQYLAIVNCAAMNIGVHRFFWRGCGEKGTSLVGMQTGVATVEHRMEFPQKTKNGTAL